jgi:hypothetical protein
MSAQTQIASVNTSSPSRPKGVLSLRDNADEITQRLSAELTDRVRPAAMVSNLLVVLCSEQATQQVVNTGSLYS